MAAIWVVQCSATSPAWACRRLNRGTGPISPQYLQESDLLVDLIGARTTDPRLTREMYLTACPSAVGFKNGTERQPDRCDQCPEFRFPSPNLFWYHRTGPVSYPSPPRANQYGMWCCAAQRKRTYDSVSVSLCEKDLEKAGIAPTSWSIAARQLQQGSWPASVGDGQRRQSDSRG